MEESTREAAAGPRAPNDPTRAIGPAHPPRTLTDAVARAHGDGWRPGDRCTLVPALPTNSSPASSPIPVGALFGLMSMPQVDTILSAALALSLLGVVGALAYAFWREVRNDTVFLEPIEVPQELIRRGFSAAVVAARLLDESRALQRGAAGTRPRRVLENIAALADLQLPGGQLSIRAVVKYARSLFGRPASRISGEITEQPEGYTLRLRIGSVVIEPVGGPHPPAASVEQVIHDGAQDLLQAVDPYSLASYYFMGPEAGASEHPNTIRLLRQVERSGTPEDRAWALGLWGTILVAEHRDEDAMAKYRASLAAHHRVFVSVALGNLVTTLNYKGHDDQAVAEIEAIEARRPVVTENLLAVAQAYTAIGKWDRALSAANRAARLARRNAMAHLARGYALGGLHRHVESIAALHRARELEGAMSPIEFGLAWQLSLAGQADEALRVAQEAVARIPNGHNGNMALGFAELAAGNAKAAIAAFERADRAFAHYEICKAGWGDALLADGQPEAAIAKYEDSISENAHTAEAWRGWGEALTKLSRHGEALVKFERAAKEDANDPRTPRSWAIALAALGYGDEAQSKRKIADEIERRNASYSKVS